MGAGRGLAGGYDFGNGGGIVAVLFVFFLKTARVFASVARAAFMRNGMVGVGGFFSHADRITMEGGGCEDVPQRESSPRAKCFVMIE